SVTPPLGRSSLNTQSKQPEQYVKIIHGAHPLRGQSVLVVVQQGRYQDTNQLLIELLNGKRCYIPVSWTDLGGLPEYPDGVRFVVEKLIQLRQRLDVLQKHIEGDTIASKNKAKTIGGYDANPEDKFMDANEPSAARPGGSSVGSHDPAYAEPSGGG
ncbi:MAG: hypothetical protein P4L50_19940, partial [Anaerolineaceae bacterium]|nr:hypothetical protein [Anaerolineaceae bacterium]